MRTRLCFGVKAHSWGWRSEPCWVVEEGIWGEFPAVQRRQRTCVASGFALPGQYLGPVPSRLWRPRLESFPPSFVYEWVGRLLPPPVFYEAL